MDLAALGQLPLDGVMEGNELLLAVTVHVLADHRTVKDVQRRKQAGGAVAPVIMHPGPWMARCHRKRRPPRWTRRIMQETIHSFRHVTSLPTPHAGLRLAGPAHDLHGAAFVDTLKDNPCPPDMLLPAVAVRDDRFQTAAVLRTNGKENT